MGKLHTSLLLCASFSLLSGLLACTPDTSNSQNNSTVATQDGEGRLAGYQLGRYEAVRIIDVASQAELIDAIASAVPGDHIVLADGDWVDLDLVFSANGTQDAPIVLKAQTPGGVILTGQSALRISGEHLVVENLVFKDGYSPRNEVVSFRTDSETLANNVTVSGLVIDSYNNPSRTQREIWVALYGKNNKLVNSHLAFKFTSGPTLAVRLNTPESLENNHLIAYNYFGPRPIFGSNGGETFRIGTSHYSMEFSGTRVENNYFDRCSGEVEIISNKSRGNQFVGNSFYASRGTLTLRHGGDTVVENNYFDGKGQPYTGGVRVINPRQSVRNNYFKDLTGIRFSGALVVMNGVPNSPINRYHQVDGAVISDNIFENVSAIELGEGSDSERTAIPINTEFTNNTITNESGGTPFNLYDDMSGIRFEGNKTDNAPPDDIAYGFSISGDSPVASEGQPTPGIDKTRTGAAFYPKPEENTDPFEQGREISVPVKPDAIGEAIRNAEPGDILSLQQGGIYSEGQILLIDKPIRIIGPEDGGVTILFERNSLFNLSATGQLELKNLTISGQSSPDAKGNAVITSSNAAGAGNLSLTMDNIVVKDLDVNGGFSVLDVGRGTFFDHITVTNSSFENISGHVFKLDQETDDFGIYNAEYLTIENSTFSNIGGSVAKVYRGGKDESTFGPHIDVSRSSFENIRSAVLDLHGLQHGSFVDNMVAQAENIELVYTTGRPVFKVEANQFTTGDIDSFIDVEDVRN